MIDSSDATTGANTDTPAVTDEMIDAAVTAAWNASGDVCEKDGMRAALTAGTADLRRQLAEAYAVIALGYDVARAATERWKADSPDARKDVLFADAGSLYTWLMAEVDKTRAERDNAIRSAANKLRAAANGRRQYLARWSNTDNNLARSIEQECRLIDHAANVVEGDLKPLFGWLPSWLWTDEMNATLSEPAQRIQRETPPPPAAAEPAVRPAADRYDQPDGPGPHTAGRAGSAPDASMLLALIGRYAQAVADAERAGTIPAHEQALRLREQVRTAVLGHGAPDPDDDPDAGISEQDIHAMPAEDVTALASMYGLTGLVDRTIEEAGHIPTDLACGHIRRALVIARNRGWDAAEQATEASRDLVPPHAVDNGSACCGGDTCAGLCGTGGITWLELDSGHDEPRLVLTGDIEALRALAGRFPAYAPIEETTEPAPARCSDTCRCQT